MVRAMRDSSVSMVPLSSRARAILTAFGGYLDFFPKNYVPLLAFVTYSHTDFQVLNFCRKMTRV